MTIYDGHGRTVLVTGASSGIGKALAEVFAEHGFGVILSARREQRLAEIADAIGTKYGVPTTVVPVDLAQSSGPRQLFDAIAQRGLQVDALVNNAGYGIASRFRDQSWETHAAFLQVMLTAVVQLTHLFEPGMTERRYGRILNVSSLAALVPGSGTHTMYGATKAFVVKFSESLALDHRGDNVHVTALCPGFTLTEFHDLLGNRAHVSRLPDYMWMDATTVAREGFSAVMAGKVVHIPGKMNRVIASAIRTLPEAMGRRAMQRQARRIGDGN